MRLGQRHSIEAINKMRLAKLGKKRSKPCMAQVKERI
jgi:hypothetical protein